MAANDRLTWTTTLTEVQTVTPDDNADLPGAAPRALYVGVTGNVTVIPWDGAAAVTLGNLAAGVWHQISVRRVLATGTAATGILVGR